MAAILLEGKVLASAIKERLAKDVEGLKKKGKTPSR